MSRWDYDLKLSGAMSFVYFNSTYRYARLREDGTDEPDSQFSYGLVLFMAVPSINETLSMHSPIGTTFLTLGVGPGFYTYSDSLGSSDAGLALMARVQFGQRVFVSERWFIQGALNLIFPGRPLVNNSAFILNNYIESVFAIGYYFPELKSWSRFIF